MAAAPLIESLQTRVMALPDLGGPVQRNATTPLIETTTELIAPQQSSSSLPIKANPISSLANVTHVNSYFDWIAVVVKIHEASRTNNIVLALTDFSINNTLW